MEIVHVKKEPGDGMKRIIGIHIYELKKNERVAPFFEPWAAEAECEKMKARPLIRCVSFRAAQTACVHLASEGYYKLSNDPFVTGALVLIKRGSATIKTGPGRLRYVHARFINDFSYPDLTCQLLENDPDDPGYWVSAGDVGHWKKEAVKEVK